MWGRRQLGVGRPGTRFCTSRGSLASSLSTHGTAAYWWVAPGRAPPPPPLQSPSASRPLQSPTVLKAGIESEAGIETGSVRQAPSWVCRAARQPSRRPPLRLQTQTLTVEADSEGEGVAEGAGDEPEAEGEEEEKEEATLLPGVVRVQCVQDLPRFDLPLLLGTFRSSTTTAVAVSHRGQPYLLTTAAGVAYGSQIRVLLPGRDKPFPARMLHLGPECELAALAVDAPNFWSAIVPYDLAPYGLPHLQQPVSVVSYEAGQPRPRTAPGTVMRTEVVTYPTAMQRLLGLTVAVALSKEQLGSAVVDSRGRCLGLVFGRTAGSTGGRKAAGGGGMGGSGGGGASGGDERWGQGRRRVGRRRGRRGQMEASATVVPVPVVEHFLEDIRRHGSYLGFPTLGIQWKRTESAALRRYTGMGPEDTGVAIVSINPTSSLAAHAGRMDVLTAVGGAAVGNDGTVAFREGQESINISYHISQFQVGDTVAVTLLRDGRRFTAPITLGVPHRLLPLHLAGAPPQFLVVSGLVLTALSAPFLEGAFGRSWAVRAPVQLLREWHNHPGTEDDQVVVVAECQDMGPGTATDGYERRAVMHQRVVRCNGTRVRNMKHLAVMVAEAIVGAEAASSLPATSSSSSPTSSLATSSSSSSSEPSTEAATEAANPHGVGDGGASNSSPVLDVDSGGGGGVGGAGGVPPADAQNLVLELSNRMVLVLPVRQAREDTRALLAEYDVQQPVSEDLRPEYEAALRRGQQGQAAGRSRGGGGKGAGVEGQRGGGEAECECGRR